MVLATKPGGLICTVIDDGLLNTESGTQLRRWVMQQTHLRAVVHLPEVTFKPNKINVRSSVLLLEKRETPDIDLLDSTAVTFAELTTLGYNGSGDAIRGFDTSAFIQDAVQGIKQGTGTRTGENWRVFEVAATAVAQDSTSRWDLKYWDPEVIEAAQELDGQGGETVRELNTIVTRRGKSPAATTYVDAQDGFAAVVKAGSCLTRFGTVDLTDADWIEKAAYDDFAPHAKLQIGDVVLASTGDGTLGKAAVLTESVPAVADGHVTIIRVDKAKIDPLYLADYLRQGFGRLQIERFFTGGTGLIELTPEHVNRIRVALLANVEDQQKLSKSLRAAESKHLSVVATAITSLADSRELFRVSSGAHSD